VGFNQNESVGVGMAPEKLVNKGKKLFSLSFKYEISLSILIPAIFSGIAIFSFIVGLNLNRSADSEIALLLGSGIAIFSFLCGLTIFLRLMRPIKNFVSTVQNLPVFQDINQSEEDLQGSEPKAINEIDQYSYMLDQATEILGKIESSKMFPNIIGQSKPMRNLFTQILKVAPTDASVLINGETGTGKELVADSIFEHSLRADYPFIKINCAAIPDDLLENELFGHEKGAFTGATHQKKGKFEIAHKGTLFLDEIADISSSLQAKLLRVLQEKEISRLGGNTMRKIDVRFIFATNKNLSRLVNKGIFREDLLHRINVFPLTLPPLRERDDIAILSNHFLNRNPSLKSKSIRISTNAMQYLESYSWPGNVRELENTIHRAAILTETDVIEVLHLPKAIVDNTINITESPGTENSDIPILPDNLSIDDYLNEMERKLIMAALVASRGKQTEAADLLNIKQRSLWHRIKKYQINVASLKKNIKI